jgi:hypothetical protein
VKTELERQAASVEAMQGTPLNIPAGADNNKTVLDKLDTVRSLAASPSAVAQHIDATSGHLVSTPILLSNGAFLPGYPHSSFPNHGLGMTDEEKRQHFDHNKRSQLKIKGALSMLQGLFPNLVCLLGLNPVVRGPERTFALSVIDKLCTPKSTWGG